MTEGTDTKYMLTDALGSVKAVYDASTASVEFTTYDVCGNSETAPASPYGYAGMRVAVNSEQLSVNTLYLTPNRAYSPRLGRWLQSDPLGTTPNPQTGNVYSPLKQYSDGMNIYAYVGNEPVTSGNLPGTCYKRHCSTKGVPMYKDILEVTLYEPQWPGLL